MQVFYTTRDDNAIKIYVVDVAHIGEARLP